MENQVKARPKQTSTLTSKYLLVYNAVSLALWSVITLRALIFIPTLAAERHLYGLRDALFSILRFTQSLALLEVAHASFGIVRASPFTTAMQVSSRLFLVWGVLTLYPEVVVETNVMGKQTAGTFWGPIALAGCHLAWGVTEMIRYGFFVWKEGVSDRVPEWLTWLRYNTFFVLYPLGITSECVLMYLAIEPAKRNGLKKISRSLENVRADYVLWAVLLIYVPGSYILYTHMMGQRRRISKGKNKIS